MAFQRRYAGTVRIAVAVCVLAGAFRPDIGVSDESITVPLEFFGVPTIHVLLRDSKVRTDVGLSQGQLVQIRAASEEYQSGMVRIVREIRSAAAQERDGLLKENLKAHADGTIAEFKRILTREQQTRLAQIMFQRQLDLKGTGLLAHDAVIEVLGLVNDEATAFKALAQREAQTYHEACTRHATEITTAIFAVLTPAQRDRFDEMYGERFGDATLGLAPSPYAGSIPWIPEFDLLRDDGVRKHLELLDEQYAACRTLADDLHRDLRALIREARNSDSTGAERALALATQRVQSEALAGLDEVLLPHQLKRLRQLIFQARVHAQNRFQPLQSPLVVETLRVTTVQQQRLAKTAKDEQAKVRAKQEMVLEHTLRVCLDTLNSEQQARYHRMVGLPFTRDADP